MRIDEVEGDLIADCHHCSQGMDGETIAKPECFSR